MSLYAADRSSTDLLLRALVQTVDTTDLSFSITVTTAGGLLTGELVSAQRWLMHQQQLLAAVPNGEGLAGAFDGLATEYAADSELDEAASRVVEEGQAATGFLHLIDGGPAHLGQEGRRGAWRVALVSVSAWMIGRVSSVQG